MLPEIVHLPAVMLLVMAVASGIALPVAVPFAISLAPSSISQWAGTIGVLVGTIISTYTTWFGFRAARKSLPTAQFLGFSSRLWSVAIPLGYFTGFAFGVYLLFLFYI